LARAVAPGAGKGHAKFSARDLNVMPQSLM
jgi:hypothetical protein